jgi:hypothetical protein
MTPNSSGADGPPARRDINGLQWPAVRQTLEVMG